MKRIGILTITDYLNYGNRLQNYATQEILKNRGFDVTSIANKTIPPRIEGMELLMLRIKNAIGQSPITLFRKGLAKLDERRNKHKYNAGLQAKEKSFREFSNRYLVETEYTISPVDCPADLGERFDYFVVGSDQIWNPNIRYGSPIDFLTFAPVEKRIALAPSFGVSSIQERYFADYRNWISAMKYVSVREEAGAKIIKNLTNKEVPVLIDPTLMLSKQDWLRIAEPGRNKPDKPFLLTYFIGAVSKKRMKVLNRIATDNKLELVMMASLDDLKRYDANPGEFVDFINSASLVCTDSFHAIIFSMQMEKPFVVFDREGKSAPMSSRIETLLGKFKFQDRLYSNMKDSNKMFEIDFSHVAEILNAERGKVNDFLDNALVAR